MSTGYVKDDGVDITGLPFSVGVKAAFEPDYNLLMPAHSNTLESDIIVLVTPPEKGMDVWELDDMEIQGWTTSEVFRMLSSEWTPQGDRFFPKDWLLPAEALKEAMA